MLEGKVATGPFGPYGRLPGTAAAPPEYNWPPVTLDPGSFWPGNMDAVGLIILLAAVALLAKLVVAALLLAILLW